MHLSRFAVALFCTCTLVLSGCSKPSAEDDHDHSQHSATDDPSHETAVPAPTAQHGASNAVPGSHEDWCGEHEVPESKCTRCDPKLTAAFKATGDWCPEHGLPESQCVQCDPSRKMVRPPKAGGN